jgi:hypothetical protein
MILYKGAKYVHWRKDILFNKKFLKNWLSTCRRVKLNPSLSPCTKINTKCIKELNVKIETTTRKTRVRRGNDFLKEDSNKPRNKN